jgi:hypothetical protein
MMKGSGRHMVAMAKDGSGRARGGKSVPPSQEGFFVKALPPGVREVDKAVLVNNLASGVAPNKKPIKIRIHIKGATDKGTVQGDSDFRTNHHPRREEGSKGVAIMGTIREMLGKCRVNGLVGGDEVSKGGGDRCAIQEVNRVKTNGRGRDRVDEALGHVALRGQTDKRRTARGVWFSRRGGGVSV